MRPETDVRRVFELWAAGNSKKAIARATGVSRAQIRLWLNTGLDAVLRSPMRQGPAKCPGPDSGPLCLLIENVDEQAYAYLLGQYLGDGCLSASPRGVFKLRIQACDAYPRIMDEIEASIRAVMPKNAVFRTHGIGCTEVSSLSKHWPCFFPQHGPGRKHLRPIVLEQWQEQVALDRHPQELLRGLVHSDGCRVMNWVVGHLKDGPKRYTYPRYLFSNESVDILGIFVEACHRVDVECRPNLRNSISVAKRFSVQRLDSFIGPKS